MEIFLFNSYFSGFDKMHRKTRLLADGFIFDIKIFSYSSLSVFHNMSFSSVMPVPATDEIKT